MVLETNRLLLSEWEPHDWIEFFPIATDPEVMKYIGNGEPWSRDRIETFVRNQIEGLAKYRFCLWKLDEKATGKIVGFCGLQHLGESNEIEVGWWLAKSSWGKGMATESARMVLQYGFEEIGLKRIVAIAQPANSASIHVMKKLGMRYEKDAVDRHGVMVVLYSIENRAQKATDK